MVGDVVVVVGGIVVVGGDLGTVVVGGLVVVVVLPPLGVEPVPVVDSFWFPVLEVPVLFPDELPGRFSWTGPLLVTPPPPLIGSGD